MASKSARARYDRAVHRRFRVEGEIMAANHGNGAAQACSRSNGGRETIISTRLAPPRCLSAVMDHSIHHTKPQLKPVVANHSFRLRKVATPRSSRLAFLHEMTRKTSLFFLIEKKYLICLANVCKGSKWMSQGQGSGRGCVGGVNGTHRRRRRAAGVSGTCAAANSPRWCFRNTCRC